GPGGVGVVRRGRTGDGRDGSQESRGEREPVTHVDPHYLRECSGGYCAIPSSAGRPLGRRLTRTAEPWSSCRGVGSRSVVRRKGPVRNGRPLNVIGEPSGIRTLDPLIKSPGQLIPTSYHRDVSGRERETAPRWFVGLGSGGSG